MKIIAFLAIFAFQFSGTTELMAKEIANPEPVLNAKEQSIVTIAALTTRADLERLKPAIDAGLDAGLTINQIQEVMIHLYAYAGFPRSLRGLQTFMSVLDEREAQGKEDEWGPEASAITDTRSRYVRGKEILEELTGVSQEGPKTGYAAFAPEVEVFLKEHLFADIFERDVLTYQERELVTISVLSCLGNVEPMLRGHFNICLNIGLTPEQLQQFVAVIGSTIGSKEAKAVQAVLDEALKTSRSD